MVIALRWLFAGILVGMLALTTAASLDRGIVDAAGELWPDPWFRATLADAYFGFVTVWLWIAYRERALAARCLWFVLVMALGNIAIAAYLLRVLWQARPDEPMERILLRAPGR